MNIAAAWLPHNVVDKRKLRCNRLHRSAPNLESCQASLFSIVMPLAPVSAAPAYLRCISST